MHALAHVNQICHVKQNRVVTSLEGLLWHVHCLVSLTVVTLVQYQMIVDITDISYRKSVNSCAKFLV